MHTTNHQQGKDKFFGNEKKYRQLIETLQKGIWVVNKEGYTTFVNPSMAKMLGSTVEKMQGKNLFSYMNEHCADITKHKLERCEQNIKEKYHCNFIKKDGTRMFTLTEMSPLKDKNGDSIGALVGVQDITEYKKEEVQDGQIERELNKAQQIAHVGSWIWDIKNQNLTWTDELYRIYGVDKTFSLTFDNIVSMIHPEDREKNATKVKELLESANSLEYEFRIIRPDNNIRHIFQSIEVLRDSTGKPHRAVGIMQDITERKNAEEEIKRLAKFPAENPSPVLRINKDGEVVYSNKAGFEILDFWKTNIGEEIPKRWRNIIRKIFTSKNLKEEEEEEVNDKIFSFVISPIQEEGYVNLYGKDITKHRKAEEALRENQEKYQLITENTNDLIIITNFDKTFRYVSPSIKSLGYNSDELIGQNSFVLLHPEDRIRITSMLKQLIIGKYRKGTESRFEYRLRDKTGVYHSFETVVKLVKDESGKHAIISISRDITKRKKAEEELKNERDFSKSIVDTAQFIIMILGVGGKIISFNSYMERVSGYKIDEVKGKDWFTTFLPERDYFKIRCLFKKSLQGSQTRGNVNPIITKDGHEILIEWYDKILKDKNGKIIGVLATGQDVTERKKTEERLKKSEERYKRLFDLSPELLIETDEKGNIITLNQMMTKSLGFPCERLIGKNILNILPRKIGEERATIARKAFIDGKYKEAEDERAGKYFHNIYVPIFDSDGNKTILTIARDITEKKNTEDAIRQANNYNRGLIETSLDPLVTIGFDGKITDVNIATENATGYPRNELIGKDFSNFFTEPKKARAVYKQVFHEGEVHDYPLELKHRDGHITSVLYNASVYRDKMNKVIGVFAAARDITERKRMEEALKQSEEKYRFLFNKIPMGIGIADSNGRIMNSNPHMSKILGWTSEEFKSLNIDSIYKYPRDRKKLLSVLDKEGQVIDWDCSLKRKDGTVFYALLNTNKIEMKGKKLILTTMRDITERKIADEKIKKQNEQLKKLDQIKTDFLNTTSHELRTPVASIKGYLQMLLKQTLGEINNEQKKALEVLLRNTNRLDHLIQEILDISRLESGTMKFITEKTDVTNMVNEIIEIMQVSADLKRIKINLDIQKEIPNLMIDQELIKQVLINLVDNAIKFSPFESPINIYVTMKKGNVSFEVQDFGRGIPKNKQNKIFERFYQVESGIDRKFGGVGLGLTISKKIIDTYGGQIWVDSTVGKGSSFKFSIPLRSTKNIDKDLKEIYTEWP